MNCHTNYIWSKITSSYVRMVECSLSLCAYYHSHFNGSIMQACLDVALPYVNERKQFGEPIGNFQLVQGMNSRYVLYSGGMPLLRIQRCPGMRQVIEYTIVSCKHTCKLRILFSARNPTAKREDCAGVILYTAEKATGMALDAIQCLGGNGYINEYPTGMYPFET